LLRITILALLVRLMSYSQFAMVWIALCLAAHVIRIVSTGKATYERQLAD